MTPEALRRLERELFDRARTAPRGDETFAEQTQALVAAHVLRNDATRALDVARRAQSLLGFERIAGSEIMLLMARGDVHDARALAEQFADAPVAFGGHGLRAIVRTLVGRDDDAARDGATFVDEALATHASLARWREAARHYAPIAAHTLARYGFLHAELARAFPGSRLWRGEPLRGRTLALQLVEGLGDQLQGLRFARAAKASGARVLVGCDERLHALVRACDLADDFLTRPIAANGAHGDAEFHLVVGGWLHDSGLAAEHWPRAPYLEPSGTDDPPSVLDGLPRPRVAIAWAGNPDFALEGTRGMPYAALKRLVAATPDVTWVSIMRPDHPRAKELAATPITRRALDAGASLHTMLDTARLLRHVDLLVATDSAPAHLAGALGTPVWTLLGTTFNWRWRIDGESTPLYPSMRLIRDATLGDWPAAADRVARELAAR